jgi:hypothetical protein
MEKPDRSKLPIKKYRLHDRPERERHTPEECIAMMWQLSADAWAFMGKSDAETDVQRHLIRVVRRPS